MFKNKKNKNSVGFDLEKVNEEVIVNAIKDLENSTKNCEKFIGSKTEKSNALIKVSELSKSFGSGQKKVKALNSVSFDFYEGENIAILGGNGSGKTTLIEIIAGVGKHDSGDVLYNFDYEVSFKEKIGVQFQDSSFPAGLTVKRVITFMQQVYGLKVSPDELNAMIKIFGIDEFYAKKASTLSGGQKQRFNLLLSFVHNPKILILDELSTGLDVTVKRRIINFIKEISVKNKINIMIISHDLEEVNYIADRIIVMREGSVFVNATKDEINKKFGSVKECLDLYI